jgi:glycosyltransferase involved in cell wall biosynthesis
MLSEMDIAVHASVGPEPFGRVVAEAMICGVAVLVSDAGGPADYVEHGVTGFRVPMRDAQAMASTLAMLLDNPGRRRSVGLAARAFALKAFNPVRLGREMADFYKKILGPRICAQLAPRKEAALGTTPDERQELACTHK